MSDAEKVAVSPAPKKRRVWRVLGWTVGGLLILLVVLLGLGAWYTTSDDFQRRVGKEVVSVLEDATGGRAELGRISFNLWHLAIEANGLVIHGTEGPGEAPYVAVDRLLVWVKIGNFFSHATGSGVASHIALSLLRVEHPQVHLIIDKEGKTNQPVPKHPSTSTEPVIDTLLDLKAADVELVNGVALLNDRAIPFDLAARDLQAQVSYLAKADHYGATIDLNDLRTRMMKEPEAQSKLHLAAEVGRDMAELKEFTFNSGASSVLRASGSYVHFANPEWQAKLNGSLELKQVSVLSGVDGLTAGVMDLDINGRNCTVAPAVAQTHPKFWQRRHPKEVAPSTKMLSPDPDCKAGYLLVGKTKLRGAGYVDKNVRLHDINAGAELRITPTELLFTALTGYLPGGGSVEGDLRIVNWLGEVPANTPTTSPTAQGAITTGNKTAVAVGAQAPVTGQPVVSPVATAHAYLNVIVSKIRLETVTEVTATKQYQDLGFDTAVSGPVKVEWGGPAKDIADTVTVDANLKLAPTGAKGKSGHDIPVSGQLLAKYEGKSEVVNIQQMTVQTPGSTLNAGGVLGVNVGDPLTALRVDLTVHDLGEYDQLLQTLGLTANGKKGAAAIPVVLHGAAQFHGTASGAIAKLDVKGHLQATNLEFRMETAAPIAPAGAAPKKNGGLLIASVSTPSPAAPSAPSAVTDVQIDSLVADAEYTPQGLAVGSSTIKRGTAVLNVAGTFKPRTVVGRKGAVTYVWDDGTAIDTKVQLANAQVVDVLQIAGQQQSVPVTGTISLDVHAAGLLKNLSGGGNISLVNGVAYGEPYESANVDLTVQGTDIEASAVTLKLHGMTIAGNGGYDTGSKKLHGHIAGDNLVLSKFKTVQDANANADGTLSLVADANGTVEAPGLKANVKLANITVNGKALGELSAEAHSEGSTVSYTAKSTLVGATIDAAGQTQLTGNYETQAKVTLAGLDVAKPLAMFQPDGIKAESNIGGVITVNGPLKTPMGLNGMAEFSNFSVKSAGIELKSPEPLRISLHNGQAVLEQVHITGTDTDLRASGTAQVLGVTDPKGGKLDVKANGSVSLALAHTFDPDLITSGKVTFTVAAGGTVKDPALTGNVQFNKVNAAIDGIPNGLSDMNGTLVFNEDRLNVQSLTAMTGGGLLKIGGFLTYKNGVYADLTATGDAVRVRLNGLSGTANANFHLQGGPDSALLSGNVLLTRFGIGADVDFAAFAGAGGVSAPPDPNAATNKIRMDVHITSSPQLDFQNSYAKLAGTVDLTVRGTVAEPSVLGRVQITDGSATFASTKYQLQRGDIYFTNPVRIDPIIDLDATARIENYDITVGLHGTVANLKPTYRSEPPLSEADVFNLLALGRTQEEAQLYQEQQVQAGTDPTTSALLGGALNATVSNRVSKLFGGGSVKIDPSFVGNLGTSSARITVQQQLSQQLSLTYATNVNSSSQQLISVQYQINPNASIVATRDETGVFSVVYKIRKRYR